MTKERRETMSLNNSKKKDSISKKCKKGFTFWVEKSVYKKRENSLFCVTEFASLMSCRPQKRHQQQQQYNKRQNGRIKNTNIMRFLYDAIDDDSVYTDTLTHTHERRDTSGWFIIPISLQFFSRFLILFIQSAQWWPQTCDIIHYYSWVINSNLPSFLFLLRHLPPRRKVRMHAWWFLHTKVCKRSSSKCLRIETLGVSTLPLIH